ncbi:PilZ domain-containing protein [Lysobacter pythonis]|uniref:PilZ domain-containing protein n=1 Tax=Solilutibacter pythonis TaxID=2483112 RepID=A0A3M2HU91_9GAMM|nr:PilZ domain-containing protein [Lysobacter pythonis]RMH93306.1 PilZ domain-containing protein [Lysobacter pythonis]
MNSEYRNAARHPVRGQAEVIDTMTETCAGVLRDLSSTGMQILSSTPLLPDALYQWRFALPGGDQSFECGVQVLWVDTGTAGEHAAGARFIQIAPAYRESLRRWCEANTKR